MGLKSKPVEKGDSTVCCWKLALKSTYHLSSKLTLNSSILQRPRCSSTPTLLISLHYIMIPCRLISDVTSIGSDTDMLPYHFHNQPWSANAFQVSGSSHLTPASPRMRPGEEPESATGISATHSTPKQRRTRVGAPRGHQINFRPGRFTYSPTAQTSPQMEHVGPL